MSLARNTVIKRATDGRDHDSPLNQLLPLLPDLLCLLSDRQDQKDPQQHSRTQLLTLYHKAVFHTRENFCIGEALVGCGAPRILF